MALRTSKIKDWFLKETFLFLLCSLLLYTIAVPFFQGFFQKGFLVKIAFTVVLFTAVFAVYTPKKSLKTTLLITIFSLIIIGFQFFLENGKFLFAETIFKIFFNLCLIVIVVKYFYQCKEVSRDTISAALIGFLLMAVLFSNLYFLVELLYPNSFTVTNEVILSNPGVLNYFSLVTITTLGYGDISPVTSQARHLAVLEAFIGQMYLAVLVARLVGIHTALTFKK